jgi:hypothetical protein
MTEQDRPLWPNGNGILWTFVLLTVPVFALSFLAAGAGHGTFIPMFLLHPWAAVAGGLTDSGAWTVAGGLLEMPLYGLLLEIAKRHGRLGLGIATVSLIHASAMAAATRTIW